MDTEKFAQANIPEAFWDACYLSKDGTIFTPLTGEDGSIQKTGEEMYQEWLENRGKEPEAGPSELELLRQQVAALQAQIDSLMGAGKADSQLLPLRDTAV